MSSTQQIRNHDFDVSGLQIGFIGLFVVALMVAQVTGGKLAVITLPLVGAVLYPAGTIAYAATFFATDCMSELYGRKFATKVVNIAFLMNFVLLGLVWWSIQAPNSGVGVPQGEFAMVFSSGTNIVLGSLTAYLVAQNWDVFAFDSIRDWTSGKHLWLRNLASTGTSQLIDTTIFTLMAFWLAPQVLGIGHALPTAVLISTIAGQYFLKAIIAGVDTPLVYMAVHGIRRRTDTVRGAHA